MKNTINHNLFEHLYDLMGEINPGIADMAIFEFKYLLEPITPAAGWESVELTPKSEIEGLINDPAFYNSIQLRPKIAGKPVFDKQVLQLTQTLLAGLAADVYKPEWVLQHFTFDIRGSYFLHRTQYYTPEIKARMGGTPLYQFKPKQKQFERMQAIGYLDFMEANDEIDTCFIDLVLKRVEQLEAPIIIAIAGQTAAGKTEITERLTNRFIADGKNVTTIEIDHFLLDRDYREANGIDSLGMEALHADIFINCLQNLQKGKPTNTPQYDFISATSSHDLDGKPKPGAVLHVIQPADIIFMEGNFPFLDPEVASLIGIKAIYLTEDDVRMKRKWKRDIDYRKKYELYYHLNRYFREQLIMAEKVFKPQMASCDIIVDTTQAVLWALPAMRS